MALDQSFALKGDPAGYNTFGLVAPNYVEDVKLTASAAGSITVPTGAKWAVFSSTHDIFVNYATTANLPTGTASTDGSGCELNPILRIVEGVSTISIISESAAYVTISFWK